MKSRSRAHPRSVAMTQESMRRAAALLSPRHPSSAANDEHPQNERESVVDPLWMIAVAMAVVFALLALLAS